MKAYEVTIPITMKLKISVNAPDDEAAIATAASVNWFQHAQFEGAELLATKAHDKRVDFTDLGPVE